ncbi:MAG: bifunctional [glutamate--ammonia ligase]-adenylyl-L-tyrosine phosphorylase/[glutamate--ammonia-ligase] adenylyltransferase [Desulfuromonas sp.]|nr:bifunctional [glutamate--ammonia ligase]-adenylyl-L-tyrosine phosphorylase/[glutamate--ammonia-ligase] adenylyltransferase [Desulfuromonas sp.]
MSGVAAVLAPFLDDAAPEKNKEFVQAVEQLGFNQAEKTVTNLCLLKQVIADQQLVLAAAQTALECADPAMALNNLERCCNNIAVDHVIACLQNSAYRRQLLLLLGASTFLSSILCRNDNYLINLFLHAEVERSKDTAVMRSELEQWLEPQCSYEELQRCLRRYKYREVLRISARDLSGVADLVEVTAELSSLAAATLQVACSHCQSLLQLEYGQPLLDLDATVQPGTEPQEATFTVLGMGKFGGWELNFSSDIDLIYFYSSTKGSTTGVVDAGGKVKNSVELHQYFIKLAEWVTRAIGQVTADGFVFRVDVDLRPEGHSGELACSLAAAETYYESWGQNWERSAMMKARPVAGDLHLGEQILQVLQPFIYRRYLDYGMIDDLKQMKQKIDSQQMQHNGCDDNLKLGKGGIREIEFFTQALQLINAGKNPKMRERSTLKALRLLQAEGYLPSDEASVLRQAYIFLRTVEHRIQVVQERQTHNLPVSPADLFTLARRCGFADVAAFNAELHRQRQAVTTIYRGLFYASEDEVVDEIKPAIRFLLNKESDSDLAKDILEESGFTDPDAAYESITRFRDGHFGVQMTARVRRYYERALPPLLQEVVESPDPSMALNNLEEFLLRVRGQGTFYALLAENDRIIHLLITLFGTSKFLSRIFIQRPELLDSLVSSCYVVGEKTQDEMHADLAKQMEQARDYEDKLDIIRRFRNEEFLRIALNDLRGDVLQGSSLEQLSYLALACLRQAVEIASAELIPRFGRPFCENNSQQWCSAELAILGMGKLGGMELNYHSDLDIIFIYGGSGENRPVEGTDVTRFKKLSNQEYFSRLAQRIISVLSIVTREGRVYEIDTRLRPSGNQGPLVTSLSAYEEYHKSSAQIWERQALTKAKVVVGSPAIVQQIDEINQRVTWEKPLPDELQSEIYRLRGRMEKEIAQENADNLNIKTGRGGMVDVEFLVQYFQLKYGAENKNIRLSNTLAALQAIKKIGILPAAEADDLSDGYKFLRRLENKLRLVHDQSFNNVATDKRTLRILARRLGYADSHPEQQLTDDYRHYTERIRQLFDHYLKA